MPIGPPIAGIYHIQELTIKHQLFQTDNLTQWQQKNIYYSILVYWRYRRETNIYLVDHKQKKNYYEVNYVKPTPTNII